MKSIFDIALGHGTVLLLADIHANASALDAVIECRREGEPVLCAGDIVGYYSDPNEVCERLREIRAFVIRGNHDAYVLDALEPKPANRMKYRVDWTRAELTAENTDWLRELPQTLNVSFPSTEPQYIDRLILRHANPRDEEGYLYPDSDLSDFPLPNGTVMVVGHTHHPMLRQSGFGTFINPGSVGQPRDRKPGAAYARLDTRTGTISFLRASYDVSGYQKHLRSLGFPEETIELLSRT